MSIADRQELVARAGLIRLEIDRLAYEARRPETTPGRLTVIRQEMEILVESMLEIRREQLRDTIIPTPAARRRHWWTRRG